MFDAVTHVRELWQKARNHDAGFAAYLRDAVTERIVAGRSMDSDELRALVALSKGDLREPRRCATAGCYALVPQGEVHCGPCAREFARHCAADRAMATDL